MQAHGSTPDLARLPDLRVAMFFTAVMGRFRHSGFPEVRAGIERVWRGEDYNPTGTAGPPRETPVDFSNPGATPTRPARKAEWKAEGFTL